MNALLTLLDQLLRAANLIVVAVLVAWVAIATTIILDVVSLLRAHRLARQPSMGVVKRFPDAGSGIRKAA